MRLNTPAIAACLLMLASLVFAPASYSKGSLFKPVKDYITLKETVLGRPLVITLWYPYGHCENTGAIEKLCLHPDAQRQQVLLFSHGSMGSAENYSWLAKALASRGWVVAGISHYGESYIYGQNTIDQKFATHFWRRVEDASLALDVLADDNPFAISINWRRVVAMGHSSGGATAALLGGVQLSRHQLKDYCASPAAIADLGCRYGRSSEAENDNYLTKYNTSYKDERVNALVLLDPALGPGVIAKSAKNIELPSLIIGSRNNDFLPFEQHAGLYASKIPKASLYTLDENEGHFIYLDQCVIDAKAQGVAICADREGVNRQAAHEKMLPWILHFLNAK